MNTGAFESGTAVAGVGVAPGAGAESPPAVPAPPGASVCPSVWVPDDGGAEVGAGVGCGVLQFIRTGMQSAEGAEVTGAGSGAAPSPLTATSRHSAAAMRDRFVFSVCVQ